MKQQEEMKKPFFAQFLEAQKSVQDNTAAGFLETGISITKPILDPEHTLKYPSDGDET
jgi:hypothetical protein